jgi:hypothetical protein
VYAFSSHDNANAYLVDKMKAVLTVASSFIITLFSLLLPPSVLINSNASIDNLRTNESMNTKTTTTTIYGCESIDDFEYLHCDPFKSEFEGNNTS